MNHGYIIFGAKDSYCNLATKLYFCVSFCNYPLYICSYLYYIANFSLTLQIINQSYIRYETRQKRADAKKALKNLLFNSGSSKITFEVDISIPIWSKSLVIFFFYISSLYLFIYFFCSKTVLCIHIFSVTVVVEFTLLWN